MEAEATIEPPVPSVRRRWMADLLAVAGVWLAGALVFFRFSIFGNGFDISGNDGDARLMIFLHEHWFRVFHGDASWLSPSFFHPATRTLGYSDTLLLDQIFYAPLRLAGFDQFAGHQLTLVALNLLGFVGWFLVARTLFRLGRTWSLWWAAVAAFANSQYLTAEHAQLWATSWIPWVILGAVATWSARTRWRRFGFGLVTGLGFGLLAYSSFYVAWMWVLAMVVCALVGLVATVALDGLRRLPVLMAAARRRVAGAAGAAVGLAVVAVPFAMTYLPVVRTNGSRSYADAMFYSTRPRDIINVSATNYLWGATARSLVLPERLANTEWALVATPVLFVAALAAAAGATFALVRWRRWQDRIDRRWAVLSFSAGSAMVAMTVMPMQFPWGSLWVLPWNVVPGAHAIRAVGRAALFATPLALVAIGAFGASVRNRREAGVVAVRIAVVLIALATVTIVEQFNTLQTTSVSRRDQLARLDAVPTPPGECRSFYLLDSSTAFVWHAETGAMLISHEVGLPTLNGYSGNAPPGFGFQDAYAPGYQETVLAWAESHGITDGLCSYDPTMNRWTVTFDQP